MSYMTIDDGFMRHGKTRRAVRAGAEALQMWFALKTYCAVNGTDGFIPDDEIDVLEDRPKNPRHWLKVLVECGVPKRRGGKSAGLVEPTDGGWQMHDYLDHSLSAEEIERRRKQARDRKQRWREARDRALQESETDTQPERETERGTDATGTQDETPTHTHTPSLSSSL